jgi:polar amino acid transport system substrate-binding protein
MRFLVLGLVALGGTAGHADEAVRLACNNFPPLKIEHPGTDGLPGSDVDLLHELFHRAGIPLQISYLPWKRALAAAQEGRMDGLCSCSFTADRAADFFFSNEIGRISVGLFTLATTTATPVLPVDTLQALKAVALTGKTVGVVDGYALEGDVDRLGIPRDLATDDLRALDMLTRQRYDYLYSYEAPIAFLTKYPRAGQTMPAKLSYQEIQANPYFLCLSRKIARNAGLVAPLNAALASMRQDGTIDRILDKYR